MYKPKNRLGRALSPYLRQHAENPVWWQEWSDEPFTHAQQEDKLVFLSIGYSTCHWCHVMAHESFSDEAVAAIVNEHFVAVKVDREERPDVDGVYMAVCQAMTRSGGWPLTIVVTPDGKPVFAGTYLPKRGRAGRFGLIDLLTRLVEVWKAERGALLQSAEQLTALLRESEARPAETGDLVLDDLTAAYRQLSRHFDWDHGGFGGAPKFPTAHTLSFLLRMWARQQDEESLAMVVQTLDGMARGGLWDQVGYGFHRYSTDERWFLPHFEKMLYDQALLASLYIEAYQATTEERFAQICRHTLTYVARCLSHDAGGFYCGENADSEGEEGTFYLWTKAELAALFGSDASLAVALFGVEERGNFLDEATRQRTGKNVLQRRLSFAEAARSFSMPVKEVQQRFEQMRSVLYSERLKRERPSLDDKVLTDWNGLTIGAFARAGRVLADERYLERAKRAADFIHGHLTNDDGSLLHRYWRGNAGIAASVDDYAYLVQGLIELYLASYDSDALAWAVDLQRIQDERFWDEQKGLYRFVAHDETRLLFARYEVADGARPSGNAVSALNLLRLSSLIGEQDFFPRAERLLAVTARAIKRAPLAHTAMLSAADWFCGPHTTVHLVGDLLSAESRELGAVLRHAYLPRTVSSAESKALQQLRQSPTVFETPSSGALAYVCRDCSCQAPVGEAAGLRALLRIEREEVLHGPSNG